MSTVLRLLSIPAFVCLPLVLAGLTAAQDAPPKLMTVQKGTMPIILSAPHGGRQAVPDVPARLGAGVKQFVTGRDDNTAELAAKLAAALEKRLGQKVYLVVAHFERKYLDANRPPDAAYESAKAKPYYDAYHQFLKESCREVYKDWGRGLLIDLHGQGADADAIFRGTQNGKSVALLADRFGKAGLMGPKSVLGHLQKNGYKVIPEGGLEQKEDKRYNGGYIVQTYGSPNTGVDALQLELGGALRKKDRLDRTAADLADAVTAFAREYLPEKKKAPRPTPEKE